jgi:hypothetical protein
MPAATPPEGTSWNQEGAVFGGKKVRLGVKKRPCPQVHFMVKKQPCPQVHFMVKIGAAL